MSRRTSSVEEKLAIFKEAEADGMTQTVRRAIYRWREQMVIGGREGQLTSELIP